MRPCLTFVSLCLNSSPSKRWGAEGRQSLRACPGLHCWTARSQNVSRLGVASRALATPLAQYSADSILGLSSSRGVRGRARPGRVKFFMWLIPALDLTGCVLGFIGVERLGGSTFTTLFSVNLVNTALFSRVFLGRRLSFAQVAAIGTVSVGLYVRFPIHAHPSHAAPGVWLLSAIDVLDERNFALETGVCYSLPPQLRSAGGGSGHPLDPTGVTCTLSSAIVYALRSVVMEGAR